MEKLTDWKARRAGGRITITGKDDTGEIVKVTGVDTIAGSRVEPGARLVVVATDLNGEKWELA